ncbi:phage holin family protein [Wenyingzhuangia sp. IMCC45533]
MKFILQLIVNGVAIILLANLLPGVYVSSLSTAIWVALVLGVLNVLVKPVLIIFTLPITVLTLGLFLLFINVIIINIAAALVSGFEVSSIFMTFVFGLLLSVLQSFLSNVFGLKES